MRIRDILRVKGAHVITVPSGHTVHQAMQAMVEHRIGALVVDDGLLSGIITERDILEFVTRSPDRVGSVRVGQIMTREVIVGVPEDPVEYVMEVMTQNRVRHLPVVEGDRLVGLLSIGDIVHTIRQNIEAENRYLHDYIAGVMA